MNRKNKSVLGSGFRVSSGKCAGRSFVRDSQLAARNPAARRGILLLVVLSMLTLFLLIGTTYIVTADHFRKSNRAMMKATEASNSSLDQGDLINEVLNQVLRDTSNPHSVLRFHSLLRDMYGNDAVMGSVDRAEWATAVTGNGENITNGQIIQLFLNSNNFTNQFGAPLTLKSRANAYNGQLLTFLDGPVRGQSTRIVGYIPVPAAPGDPQTGYLRVLAVRKANGRTLTDSDFFNLAGTRFLINGRPFNGTGLGYNSAASVGQARLSVTETDFFDVAHLTSLLPNKSFQYLRLKIDPSMSDEDVADIRYSIPDHYQLSPGQIAYLADTNNFTNQRDADIEAIRLKNLVGIPGFGGSDESYDAPDFQNMLLARVPTNPSETVIPDLDASNPQPNRANLPNSLANMVVPSAHRPALLNYWRQQLINASGTLLENEPNLLRKSLLRPSWLDHPKFTGSNPDFAKLADADNEGKLLRMIYGPWDVDNDNDGVRDSVWVDFGAPVMMNSEGRLVKPMAAMLIVDMDGRLNLNAHGSADIADPANFNALLADGASSDILHQGQGYGPAEISLAPLMSSVPYRTRMLGGVNFNEDMIVDDDPEITPANRRKFRRVRAGKNGRGNFWPGREGFDLLAQMKMQGVPMWANGRLLDASGNPTILGGYGTPPDLRGRYALGLNDFGQPTYEALDPQDLDGDGYTYDRMAPLSQDSPYETDLSLGASRGESADAVDSPFSMAEMERILRVYDADAGSLPSRIWDFNGEFKNRSTDTAPNLDLLNLWRTTVTTDTYDMPVPSVTLPAWMHQGIDKSNPVDDFVAVMNMSVGSITFADLLEYRIRLELNPANPSVLNAMDQQTLSREMKRLLPPDLANGLRLDINRPLGNGRDDNNNGVVDEPGEWLDVDSDGIFDAGEREAPYWVSTDASLEAFTGSNGRFQDERILFEDRNDDGLQNVADRELLVGTNGVNTHEELIMVHNLRRQMLARDLYVMAMTLADPPLSTATSKEKQARARRLAQWAINIVDFRDPDNIMTAFEYDVNPFDGWAADANLQTGTNNSDIVGPDSKIGTADDLGGIVWGAEGTELVMTETMAWHDRRTTDTNYESATFDAAGNPQNAEFVSAPKDADYDFDQFYRPRGACFVEIYCPLAANPAANADTHAIGNGTDDFDLDGAPDALGQDMGIQLAALDKTTGTSPVWRMAVYQRPDGMDSARCADWDPDAQSVEERPYDGSAEIKADRSIYFAPFDKADVAQMADLKNMDVTDGVEFFTTLDVSTVRPGRFMVVGSGEEQDGQGRKLLGSGVYGANIGDKDTTTSIPRRIVLYPSNLANPIKLFEPSNSSVRQVREDAYKDPDDNIRAICDVAVITNALSATGPTALSRRFTITEPAKGYPGDDPSVPTTGPSFYDQDPRKEGTYGNGAGTPAAYDTPLDDNRLDGEVRLKLDTGRFKPGDPLVVECFSMIYLQRLANPLLPFNKETNPYRTIDGMSANASVFNGKIGDPSRPGREIFQPEPDGGTATQIEYDSADAAGHFASLQRGFAMSKRVGASYQSNVFSYEPPNKEAALNGAPANPNNVIQPVPENELSSFTPGNSTKHALNAIPDMTLGRLNAAFMSTAIQTRIKNRDPSVATDIDGLTPEEPFPWLTWNNRPYASGNELLLVPRGRSSQLLREFSGKVNSTTDPYAKGDVPTESKAANPGAPVPSNIIPDYAQQQAVGLFGHLPNMFLSETPAGDKLSDVPAGLVRVLDYVHVSSPFVGTETWLNPTAFGDTTTAITSENDPRYGLQPPFNKISSYREPGRMNLNTMSETAYKGLMHDDASSAKHPGPEWDDLKMSRRGYGQDVDGILQLDTAKPTFFANPFRSSDAGDLVPRDEMLQKRAADCTLFRSDEVDTNLPAGDPLFAAKTDKAYNDAERNAYFAMQPMTRLSSMTTTRSNVYAIWITVGFFEVEPAPSKVDFKAINDPTDSLSTAQLDALYAQVYPDGYQLGKESGSDTGDIRRAREFAFIDRTVPVAFEPGKNHNVEKAIRLRRRID